MFFIAFKTFLSTIQNSNPEIKKQWLFGILYALNHYAYSEALHFKCKFNAHILTHIVALLLE